ncbi:MAG: hypothetical protein ACI8UO_003239 [Verrucomicrobiales bacterium]|jgi:hypothetical protein
MNSDSKPSHLHLTLWIAVAFAGYNILVRVLPHLLEAMGIAVTLDPTLCPWSFSPMMALCLFGAARFGQSKLIWLIAIGSFFVGDLLVAGLIATHKGWGAGFAHSFYSGFFVVYIAFAIGILMGSRLRRTNRFGPILGAGILAQLAFFVVTNFAVWIAFHGTAPGAYAFSFQGLMNCYYMGIPFLGLNALSTLIYGTIFFGGWNWIAAQTKKPVVAKADKSSVQQTN